MARRRDGSVPRWRAGPSRDTPALAPALERCTPSRGRRTHPAHRHRNRRTAASTCGPLAVARYLAAHSPTERSAFQTADIAQRLLRGPARTEENQNGPNKLLEQSNEIPLDTRAPGRGSRKRFTDGARG
jgi:hypothetical protein